MFSVRSVPRLYNEDLHNPFIEIAAPAKQGSPHHWQFSKAHTGSRIIRGFQHPVRVRFHNKIMQAASRSHTKP
jgi:hypothetical protein